jgi:hypothetical protein
MGATKASRKAKRMNRESGGQFSIQFQHFEQENQTILDQIIQFDSESSDSDFLPDLSDESSADEDWEPTETVKVFLHEPFKGAGSSLRGVYTGNSKRTLQRDRKILIDETKKKN